MPWLLRLFALALVPCWVWFGYLAVQQWRDGDPDTPWWVAALVDLEMIGFVVGTFLCFIRPRVVLSDNELEIRNVIKTYRVNVADIVSVNPESDGTVISLVNGTKVVAWALQKGLGAKLLRIRTGADRAVEAILRTGGLPYAQGGRHRAR